MNAAGKPQIEDPVGSDQHGTPMRNVNPLKVIEDTSLTFSAA